MKILRRFFDALAWKTGILENHDLLLLDFYKSELDNSTNPFLCVSNLNSFSQADEVGILRMLLSEIEFNGVEKFVEFGVGDGTENNSLNFLLEGWEVWWFGNELLNLDLPIGFSKLHYTKDWITKEKLSEHLAELKNFDPSIVSMDLDGNDYHFTELLLESNVKPQIWVQEYNANLGAHAKWVMPYNQTHSWDLSTQWGASLSSFVSLFEKFGYKLVTCNLTGVNAFFVREELLSEKMNLMQNSTNHYRPYRPWFMKSKQKVSSKILNGIM